LYGIRRILLRGAENQSKTSYTRLLAGLAAGDPDDQVATAYIAAQQLRHVYGAIDLAQAQAQARLFTFYTVCADSSIPELHRLARTITAWQNQLLAYFTTGRASNGPTEAVNLLVKRIKRVGSASATSTTTGYACSCTAASPGTLTAQHESGDAHHAWCRRAELVTDIPFPAVRSGSLGMSV
jgi:transposase